MNQPHEQPGPPRVSPRSMIGWGIAVLVVIGAWVAVLDLRAGQSGEKQIMLGWQDGLDAGQEVAREQDRPMIVLFTASWCAPCQRFKGQVLHNETVGRVLAEQFVAVQVDLSDRSSDNPNLPAARRYHVSGIPTLYAMNPAGDVLGQYPISTDSTPGDFLLWLDRVPMQASLDRSPTAGSR